jgi:FMN phosphatase YigB (HAD superfamily)
MPARALVIDLDGTLVDVVGAGQRAIARAAERLGVVPGECVVVGDSDEHDGESARRAGMGYVAADVSSVVIRVDEAIAPE